MYQQMGTLVAHRTNNTGVCTCVGVNNSFRLDSMQIYDPSNLGISSNLLRPLRLSVRRGCRWFGWSFYGCFLQPWVESYYLLH